jgi:hypothetical protein
MSRPMTLWSIVRRAGSLRRAANREIAALADRDTDERVVVASAGRLGRIHQKCAALFERVTDPSQHADVPLPHPAIRFWRRNVLQSSRLAEEPLIGLRSLLVDLELVVRYLARIGGVQEKDKEPVEKVWSRLLRSLGDPAEQARRLRRVRAARSRLQPADILSWAHSTDPEIVALHDAVVRSQQQPNSAQARKAASKANRALVRLDRGLLHALTRVGTEEIRTLRNHLFHRLSEQPSDRLDSERHLDHLIERLCVLYDDQALDHFVSIHDEDEQIFLDFYTTKDQEDEFQWF